MRRWRAIRVRWLPLHGFSSFSTNIWDRFYFARTGYVSRIYRARQKNGTENMKASRDRLRVCALALQESGSNCERHARIIYPREHAHAAYDTLSK